MKRRRRSDRSVSPSPPPPECLLKKRRKKFRYDYLKEIQKGISDLTQVERKIWVGNLNLTSDMGASELREIFTNQCPPHGIRRSRPIISIWLSKEKNFCFVEFRNIRDAETALAKWNNMLIPKLGNQPLPVGPPRERTAHSADLPILKDYVFGDTLPDWTKDQFQQISKKVRQNSRYRKSNMMYQESKPVRSREINIPIPGRGSFLAQTQNPDATIVLSIRLRRRSRRDKKDKDEAEKESANSVLEDAKRHLRKNKQVVALKDIMEDETLLVKFRNIDAAIRTKRSLESTFVTLKVKFAEEEVFKASKASASNTNKWEEVRRSALS